MFIVINRSRGKVVLDELDSVLEPGKFLVFDNLDYTDLVSALQDHLKSHTVSLIYVPREQGKVFDPISIFDNPLFQRSVRSRKFRKPPADLKNGDRFLLIAPVYGPWAGRANSIAEWQQGRWFFQAPKEGMVVWVEDEERPYVFTSGEWKVYDPTATPSSSADLLVAEVNTKEPIPAYRYVTHDGYLADAANPTHATRVVGLSLHEVTIVGQPVRVVLSGTVDLPDPIQPGINLRQVFLWPEGRFRDEPPTRLEAAFCLVVGRALTKTKIFVDVEMPVIYR